MATRAKAPCPLEDRQDEQARQSAVRQFDSSVVRYCGSRAESRGRVRRRARGRSGFVPLRQQPSRLKLRLGHPFSPKTLGTACRKASSNDGYFRRRCSAKTVCTARRCGIKHGCSTRLFRHRIAPKSAPASHRIRGTRSTHQQPQRGDGFSEVIPSGRSMPSKPHGSRVSGNGPDHKQPQRGEIS